MAKERNGSKHHEEEGAGEAWLLPYSDLMTLLLAVFIVLYAVSKQDEQKVQAMAQAFNTIFSGGAGIIDQGDGILDGQSSLDPNIIEALKDNPYVNSGLTAAQIQSKQEDQMSELEAAFETYIAKNNLSGSMQIKNMGTKLMVTLASDILFPSGSAELTPEQTQTAHTIAGIINDVQKNGFPVEVKISGHTDNVPINTAQYPSNWYLSLDRAVKFAEALVEGSELDPRAFSAVGCGDLNPIDTNDTSDGRTRNRRVEILLYYQDSSTQAPDSQTEDSQTPDTQTQDTQIPDTQTQDTQTQQ